MLVAILASTRSGKQETLGGGGSECGWYFVVYFADASLGITLALSFHKLSTTTARYFSMRRSASWSILGGGEKGSGHPWWEALIEIGNYGDPPSYKRWGIQVFFWVLCVVTARLMVGLVIINNLALFQLVTLKMDSRFHRNPNTYLFLVMVGIPVTFNVLQAMLQDQVLKFKASGSGAVTGGFWTRAKLKVVNDDGGSPSLKEKRSGAGAVQQIHPEEKVLD
jgi:hypothetical protein